MDKSLLVNALEFKNWADRRIIAALEELDSSKSASTLSFARQQLNHLVRVEENFRARLLGTQEPNSTTNTEQVPVLLELVDRLNESNSWLTTYLESIDSLQLDEVVRFTFVDGLRGKMNRAEILFHLINHGSYHRGAIGRALDLAGARRPADTYTVFIHATEPHRRDA